VLIEVNTFQQSLFRHISWSTQKVLAQTLKQAKANNLSVVLLEPETDVDTAEDLKKLRISVIIPDLTLSPSWAYKKGCA